MALMAKARVERVGQGVTGACIALVTLLVVTLVAMVAGRGIATFTADGIDLGSFLTGTTWNPHQEDANGMPTVGALPMIAGSFSVTLLSTLFAVEVAPRFGRRVFQPRLELMGGIPAVVYGLIGLTIIVAWVRDAAGAMGQTITGFGIFSSAVVLAIMVLPTITSLSIDALAAVPHEYREGSYALGCTRWQTIWNVVLKSAAPSLMTAVILGMTRAFGEALAVQMVIGNAIQMPSGLFTPASTLTSVLTMGMGNEAMGTVHNDVLWSLALLLLAMSLVFIMIIHLIGHKGAAKRG